jgi:cytochrome d ubiquinol oxidase subunit II
MSLPILWFAIVAVFWTGFFVLEGFDFGVGALHRVVGRTDLERRVAINSIGPLWDGNEVWLIVAGAAMFAAFPGWYATWFSALYLALVLVLVALILRGVSFEFRGKSDRAGWRSTWSTTLTVGSVVAPLLVGVGIGDLLAGLPIGSDEEYTGGFVDLLTPFGLTFGLTLLVLCLLHGATFLGLRTTGVVRDRAHATARRLRWPVLVLVIVAAAWTFALSGQSVLSSVLLVVVLAGALGAWWYVGRSREGAAFGASAMTIGAAVASVFAGLYPHLLVSSTDPAYSLTVEGTASGSYALTVITVVAAVLFPVVLLYQGWSYHVFRARVTGPAVGETDSTPAP